MEYAREFTVAIYPAQHISVREKKYIRVWIENRYRHVISRSPWDSHKSRKPHTDRLSFSEETSAARIRARSAREKVSPRCKIEIHRQTTANSAECSTYKSADCALHLPSPPPPPPNPGAWNSRINSAQKTRPATSTGNRNEHPSPSPDHSTFLMQFFTGIHREPSFPFSSDERQREREKNFGQLLAQVAALWTESIPIQ